CGRSGGSGWVWRDKFGSDHREQRLSRELCAAVRCKPHATGSDSRVQGAVADCIIIEAANAARSSGDKGGVDFILATGMQDKNLSSNRMVSSCTLEAITAACSAAASGKWALALGPSSGAEPTSPTISKWRS